MAQLLFLGDAIDQLDESACHPRVSIISLAARAQGDQRTGKARERNVRFRAEHLLAKANENDKQRHWYQHDGEQQ